MKEIRVHIDTLEYTRDGLATRAPVSATVGEVNRVVLVRPKRVHAFAAGLGGFASDSCFPTPAALTVFLAISLGAGLEEFFASLFGNSEKTPSRIFQLYGHADRSGEEAHNKALSERRAEAIRAILTRDVDAFVALGEAEGWGLFEQQVMLRTLHCDPGPIDGDTGLLTEQAVFDFQEDYKAGVFHQHAELAPSNPGLAVDGDLGPDTFKALLEAFVTGCSPGIPEEQMHPTHPAVGCSEFNRVSESRPSLNRRVSLIMHDALPPHHDAAPCVDGDHQACPFDGRSLSGCLWYREHVRDPVEAEFAHHHYDLRWLYLNNGGFLLSALTTLQDGEDVRFQVFRTKVIFGPEDLHDSSLGDAVSESMLGVVRGGVAQVVWLPDVGEGVFDPLDVDGWYEVPSLEEAAADPTALWNTGPGLRPPVFRVSGGNSQAISHPPGQDAHRIRLEAGEGGADENPLAALCVDVFGRVLGLPIRDRRLDSNKTIREGGLFVKHFDVLGAKSVDEGVER